MSSDPLETLPRSFYERDVHELARALLGCKLVRELDGERLVGRIIETEAYGGPHDPACHADSGNPTERTRSMFGPPGTAYVYQIYGMYHCLNVVAPAETKAAAVLIRALRPLRGLSRMARQRDLADRYTGEMPERVRKNLLSGPGKLCQAMAIDRELDGCELARGSLWLAPGEAPTERPVERTQRIGLNPETVGEAAEWPWRYVVADSAYLSR